MSVYTVYYNIHYAHKYTHTHARIQIYECISLVRVGQSGDSWLKRFKTFCFFFITIQVTRGSNYLLKNIRILSKTNLYSFLFHNLRFILNINIIIGCNYYAVRFFFRSIYIIVYELVYVYNIINVHHYQLLIFELVPINIDSKWISNTLNLTLKKMFLSSVSSYNPDTE
jgi:hypothetical protein